MAPKKRKRRTTKESPVVALFLIVLMMVASFYHSLKEGQWWAILTLILMIAATGTFLYLFFIKKYRKSTKYLSVTMKDVLSLSPSAFELFVVSLYQRMGYSAKHTGSSGDDGVDVVAEKNQTRYAIQVKKYEENVGFSAIQQVNTGKVLYHCHEAVVITTALGFTRSARINARKLRIQLIARDGLGKLIQKYMTNSIPTEKALEAEK